MPLAASPMAARPFGQSQFRGAGPDEGAVTLSLGRDNKVSGTTSSRNTAFFDDQRYSREQEASGEYETDDDDDSRDDSEDERGQISSKVKVALVSLVVAGIVGVASYFAYQVLGPAKHGTSNTAAASKNAKADFSYIVTDLVDVGTSEPNPNVASIKLTDAKYFSKVVTIAGEKCVQFDFPAKSGERPLALIGTSIERMQAAAGTVRIPFQARIYLMPFPDSVFKTQFFSKFRPGEVAGIFISGAFASDELVIASAKTAGIRSLTIMDCSTLTPKIIPALNTIGDLDSLALHGSNLNGADFAKAKFWPNLKQLTLSHCNNLSPILKELSGSSNLQALDVTASGIGPEGYRLISTFADLKSLTMSKNKVSTDDLRRLSRLAKLRELSLVDVHIRGGLTAKDVEQFPSLSSLIVDRGHFKVKDIAYLKDRRPGLRVQYSSSSSSSSSASLSDPTHDLLLKTPERF
jgi:hypothetical protein